MSVKRCVRMFILLMCEIVSVKISHCVNVYRSIGVCLCENKSV